MSNLADKLREQIEAKYEKALKALKEIEGFLEEGDDFDFLGNGKSSAAQMNAPATTSQTQKLRRQRKDSFRARVLKVITASWASINAVAEQTGLTVQQVRGVVNAPSVGRQLERRSRESGETEYRLRSETTD